MSWPVSARAARVLRRGTLGLSCSAYATYDGAVTAASLPVGPGAEIVQEWGSKQVTSTLKLPVTDEFQRLLGMSLTSPLAPFGQRVTVQAVVSVGSSWSESVPMGTFHVTEPAGGGLAWRIAGKRWLASGQSISLEAGSLMALISQDKIAQTVTPGSGETVFALSKRLIGGSVPMGDWASSVTVPTGAAWSSDRVDALADVADLIGCVPAIDREGQYTPLPATPKAVPDWVFSFADPGDRDATGNVTSAPKIPFVVDGLYNGVTITGEDANNNPVSGSYYLPSGPLRWNGPFGRALLVENNPLMKASSSCVAAARTRLTNLLNKLTVAVEFDALANPAVDVLDTATLVTPAGSFTGLVSRVAHPLTPGTMGVTLAIPWTQVWSS